MAIMEVVFLAHPHGLNFSALVAARDEVSRLCSYEFPDWPLHEPSGCGSGGREGSPLIEGLMVQSSDEPCAEVSLGKTLNPKLLLIAGMAGTGVCVS